MRKLNIYGDRENWWDFVIMETYTAITDRG
jgi:hypothetical protein